MSAAHLLLNQRDLNILLMVYHYFPGCTSDHIRQRFYTTLWGKTACYARLQRLAEAGYITAQRMPALSGVGSGKALLSLGPKGRPLVAEALALGRTQLARPSRAISPFALAHHLAVCDFRLAAEHAAEQVAHVSLLEWRSDHELHRQPIRLQSAGQDKALVLIPDAAFTLQLRDTSPQPFFVEVDRNSLHSPERFKAKLAAYLRFAQQQPYPTPVLFVVPTSERQATLGRWIKEQAQDMSADPTSLWSTTKDQVSATTVLSSPIWQVAEGPLIALLPSSPSKSPGTPLGAAGPEVVTPQGA